MSKEVTVYQCEKCGEFYRVKYVADECCKEKLEYSTCNDCGTVINKNRSICTECWLKNKFEKGKKIKYSEYKEEYLYDESSEKYFSDLEELEEYYYEIEINRPKWVFGCYGVPFQIDIDSALENASEEQYEDFDYENESIDLKDLLDFVEEWNKKQITRTWNSDYGQIILLDE